MSRLAVVCTIVLVFAAVLLPTLALAVSAWRPAEAEREKGGLMIHDAMLAHTRAEVERELEDAVRRAEASPAVAFATDGKWVGYSSAAPRGTAESAASAEELRLYLLARRGGESFEARGDAERALDAYTFYLSRILEPQLRDRLRLAAARVAESSGKTRLARLIFGDLFAGASDRVTEGGLPIDLVAAARLLAREPETDPADEDLRRSARERLAAAVPAISTAMLARFAAVLAPEDAEIQRLVEDRRRLEEAAAARPDVLASRSAAVSGSTLLIAREEDATGAGSPARARSLRCSELSFRRDALWPCDVAWSGAEPPSARDAASIPVHLPGTDVVLGAVSTGLGLGADRFDFDIFRDRRALVVLNVFSVLLGNLAVVLLFRRERQLARLRARLLANVSHELKTPVTSIRMFAEMLGQPGLDAAQAGRFKEHLRRETARLSQLLENLLDLSRPERTEQDLLREPIDVAALLREVAAGFGYRAREAGIDFRTEGIEAAGAAGGEGSLVLETNSGVVERIVLNLLDNALKYRRESGSRVVLSLRRGARGRALIEVEDNGPGIPRGEQARVFEEFYRVRYDDYAVKGAGLGLSIARRLARKLGGDVLLRSREGEGSAFTLVLPVALKEAA